MCKPRYFFVSDFFFSILERHIYSFSQVIHGVILILV